MTDDLVAERLRFLAAAQHEANTPLAIIRGWSDTFAAMWHDLQESDRQQGVDSIRRYATVLTELLDALFVELRADAHAHAHETTRRSADLVAVVPLAVDQTRQATLVGDVPDIAVAVDPDALEALLATAASGLATSRRDAVSLTVEQHADGALVTVSTATGGETPAGADVTDGGVGAPDPFDPFPGGDLSPSGIRLYAARRLAVAVGGRLSIADDGRLLIVLPLA